MQKIGKDLIDTAAITSRATEHGRAIHAQVSALLKSAEVYEKKYSAWRQVSADQPFNDLAAAFKVVYGNLRTVSILLAEAIAFSPNTGKSETEGEDDE